MKLLNKLGLSFLTLLVIACGSEKQNQDVPMQALIEPEREMVEITDENLKQSKKALLQQMANNLYLEAEKELAAAPRIEMDQAGIYDDIEPVKVEVEPEVPLSLDLDVEEKDENP